MLPSALLLAARTSCAACGHLLTAQQQPSDLHSVPLLYITTLLSTTSFNEGFCISCGDRAPGRQCHQRVTGPSSSPQVW